MQAKIKSKNKKELKVKSLVDSECTHTGINEQLFKDKKIQMRLTNFLFGVYNADRTKNRNITRVASLEVEISGHKEHLETAVTDLNRTDIFLGHNWLVKHNSEVDWKDERIQFTRCPKSCKIKY